MLLENEYCYTVRYIAAHTGHGGGFTANAMTNRSAAAAADGHGGLNTK